ncbi:SDR family NAD(P)-dependent oxidoreductase [Dermatobacter hominis]|uniref:SDR family NAD(P)-dependent oxidoreductase n=1 Tax=Dermatobacter hominis TaxID=2884263 RepID=UPI001D0FE722|nr:SDR family oxidoreductase [Dermatobacter hominis]UDY34293.1 SDR family oxidoreductase [Dermatobacter hominis]
MELDLTGRRVLVTGAGQGVGLAIAEAFAGAGATVVVNDLDPARTQAAVERIAAGGGRATASAFDVTDPVAVADAVAACGPVDVLVNNAGNAGAEGFGGRGPFAESDPQDWEPFIRVNLYGAMHCSRAVLPGMIESGWGRLITIVSDAGRIGDPGSAAYSAAKAGSAGLTRALARENGRFGITANNLSLGTMRTDATEALWSEPDSDRARQILRNYAIRRPGDPGDAGAVAVFLATEHASWITGQTLPLNGGYSFAL